MTFSEALSGYLHPMYRVPSLYFPTPADPMGQSIDNFHLFTAHAVALMERLGEDTTELRAKYADFYETCCPVPGAPRRFPTSTGDVSFDEIIGAAYLGWGSQIALELFQYGMKTDFTWDIQEPARGKLMYEFSRNITFVPFLRACARVRVGQISQILWSIGLLLSLFSEKSNTSGKILVDLMLEPMQEAGGIIARSAISIWLAFMERQYPGGRFELYQIYFPHHPLGVYQKREWSVS